MAYQPSYVKLMEKGELERRAAEAMALLERCRVCPWHCEVNRQQGERGFCRAGERIRIASYGPHFGEEEVLVGEGGSGTIFFAYCNLACIFCQNYDISQEAQGSEVGSNRLAEIMLSLQKRGCHNVNLVSPTHYAPQIISAVAVAAEHGLRLPIVYNCGGYEDVEMLKLLEGIVDIYMPDLKYADEAVARRLSKVKHYPEIARKAVKEMHRQVGDLVIDDQGLAVRGLLVRHLVLPNDLAGTKEIMRFLAREISPNTYVNIMSQYYPAYRAWEEVDLARRVTKREYEEAVRVARGEGLWRFAD